MFDRHYITNERTHNELLKPILVRKNPVPVFDALSSYVADNGFGNISLNKEFSEIYGEMKMFEVTFIVINNHDGTTSVNIQCYCDRFLGGSKAMIKELSKDLRKLFS